VKNRSSPIIVIPKRNVRFAPHIPPRGGIKKGGNSDKTNWNYYISRLPVIIIAFLIVFFSFFSGCNPGDRHSSGGKTETVARKSPGESDLKIGSDDKNDDMDNEDKDDDRQGDNQKEGGRARRKRKKAPSSSLFIPYTSESAPKSKAHRLITEGDALYNKGNFDGAMEKYKRALKMNPKLDEAHVRLGDIYLRKGFYKKSGIEFQKAIKINPLNKFARFGYADILLEEGKPKESRLELKKVLNIDPEFAAAYTSLGDIYVDLKKYDKAEQMFEKSLKVNIYQAYPDTYIGLGELYLETKRYKKALNAFIIAQEKDPYDIDGFLGAARTLTRIPLTRRRRFTLPGFMWVWGK